MRKGEIKKIEISKAKDKSRNKIAVSSCKA